VRNPDKKSKIHPMPRKRYPKKQPRPFIPVIYPSNPKISLVAQQVANQIRQGGLEYVQDNLIWVMRDSMTLADEPEFLDLSFPRDQAVRAATVSFFRTLLTRPEAYEAREEHFMACLISEIVDLDALELYPEIKQVFDEDRLEPGVLDLDFIHEKWDRPRITLPPRRMDGLYLPLECQNCGRIREHFSEYVLVDINSLGKEDEAAGYGAHILDHAIVCPKCGVVDRYRLTSLAHLRLAGPFNIPTLARILEGKPPDKLKPNPQVLYFRSAVFGKLMHPLDGLDEYRRRIAIHPRDADLHARMGALLRTLMRYPEALQAFRRAYELAPNDPDVLIRRALSEHDLGNKEIARQLYEKIIGQDRKKKGLFERLGENTFAALEGLQMLARNKPSPWEAKHFTLSDETPVDHPSMHPPKMNKDSFRATVHEQEKRSTKRGRRRKRIY
jgi:tetratricopeptide (TPR) repeat protein